MMASTQASSNQIFLQPLLSQSDLDILLKFLTFSLDMRSVPEDHDTTVVGRSRSVVSTTLNTIVASLSNSEDEVSEHVITVLKMVSDRTVSQTDLDIVSIIIDTLNESITIVDAGLVAALAVVRQYPTIANWKTALAQFPVNPTKRSS